MTEVFGSLTRRGDGADAFAAGGGGSSLRAQCFTLWDPDHDADFTGYWSARTAQTLSVYAIDGEVIVRKLSAPANPTSVAAGSSTSVSIGAGDILSMNAADPSTAAGAVLADVVQTA